MHAGAKASTEHPVHYRSKRADNMRGALTVTHAAMLERLKEVEHYKRIRDEAQRAVDARVIQLKDHTRDVAAIVEMDTMGMRAFCT